jgi:hypothetical protein
MPLNPAQRTVRKGMPAEAEISALEEKYRKMRQELLKEYPWPITRAQKEGRDQRLAALDDQHSAEVAALCASRLK